MTIRCGVCQLTIPDADPVVFAKQGPGTGPYPGMSGWYVTEAHGADALAEGRVLYRDDLYRLTRPENAPGPKMWAS